MMKVTRVVIEHTQNLRKVDFRIVAVDDDQGVFAPRRQQPAGPAGNDGTSE